MKTYRVFFLFCLEEPSDKIISHIWCIWESKYIHTMQVEYKNKILQTFDLLLIN